MPQVANATQNNHIWNPHHMHSCYISRDDHHTQLGVPINETVSLIMVSRRDPLSHSSLSTAGLYCFDFSLTYVCPFGEQDALPKAIRGSYITCLSTRYGPDIEELHLTIPDQLVNNKDFLYFNTFSHSCMTTRD